MFFTSFLGVQEGFAGHIPSLNHDLDLIGLEVLDIQVLSMDDTVGYPFDNSDLLKITVNVTNKDIEYFSLLDKMFKIRVMAPGYTEDGLMHEYKSIVDNYETTYDYALEIKYDNLQSRELFEECDYTNKKIHIGESQVITLCFDVLRIWNNEVLNIAGQKKHYLVMMNNQFMTSCPNCIKIPLSQTTQSNLPNWIQKVVGWHNSGLITSTDIENNLRYLEKSGIIENTLLSQLKDSSKLEQKNRELKAHQTQLAFAQSSNLYVSSIESFEFKYLGNFSGVQCKRQNNIVTLSGDYTNKEIEYDVIFFKLLIFDEYEKVLAIGISKIVDVSSDDFRHFSASAPYKGKLNHCLVIVDSKFSRGN